MWDFLRLNGWILVLSMVVGAACPALAAPFGFTLGRFFGR